MLADSHCHLDRLDLTPYHGDFAALMAETRAAGVDTLLCVGINLPQYPAMRELVAPYPNVWVTVGVHPNEPPAPLPAELDALVELAADPRVVAIGETGLDYYRSHDGAQWQPARLCQHIAVARQYRKPLVIHSRAAAADTIALLTSESAADVGGVFHCFSDDWTIAKQALDLGFYIGLSGVITFKGATELRDVARRIPLDRLLIETDAPYLAPHPHRGQANEPRLLPLTAAALAQVHQLSADECAIITRDNFYRLFATASPAVLT